MSDITSVPIGTIAIFPGDRLPPGWALCNGATITSIQIPNNFAALAAALNISGTNSLSLPDLQNRFILSASKGTPVSGIAGGPGNHIHSLPQKSDDFTTSSDGSHAHSYPGWYYNSTVSGSSKTTIQSSSNSVTQTSSNGGHTHDATVTIDSFNTVEVNANGWLNRPKYMALNYIIKIGIG